MARLITDEILDVIQASVRDVRVFDGVPATNLKDRPPVHVIVTMPGGLTEYNYLADGPPATWLTFQIMVVVRSGPGVPPARMGRVARQTGERIKAGLFAWRRPNTSRVEHLVERASTDAPGIASHEVFTIVSQFRVRT